MKIKTFAFLAFLLVIISCQKNDSNDPPTPPAADKYVTISTGSTWNYHETDASDPSNVTNTDYTVISLSGDTSIGGKSYHIFSNSLGGNQYLNLTGSDYYQWDSLPEALGTVVFERLYLKDNAAMGINWSQSLSVTIPGVPLPIPVTITNTIAEKGISRSVNGVVYTDVIHVTTALSSSLIPAASLTTSIDSYFAGKYGLIENSNIVHLDYAGITQDVNIVTRLVTATLL
ncbi:MAG: hypothetical protein ABI416_00065 [Ginsengibacter sp.]